MKKQIKKLSLNKKTISNLNASEMNGLVGGAKTKGQNNTCAFSCVMTKCPINTCQNRCSIGCGG